MTDARKWHGKWTSADGEMSATGYLEAEDDGLFLNLIGVDKIEDYMHFEMEEMGDLKNRGVDSFRSSTIEGKIISVFRLRNAGSSGVFTNDSTQRFLKYACQMAISGNAIIESIEKKFIKEASCHLQYLSIWSGLFSFSTASKIKSSGVKLDKRKTKYYLFRDMKISLAVDVMSNYVLPTFTINPVGLINIKYAKLASIEQYLFDLSEIRMLIELCFGKQMGIISNKIYSDRIEWRHSRKNKVYQEFNIFTNGNSFPEEYKEEAFFNFKDIEMEFQDVLNLWADASETLKRSVSIILLLVLRTELPLDSRYFGIASALESLMGEGEKKTYMPNAEYKSIMRSLKSSLPETSPKNSETKY